MKKKLLTGFATGLIMVGFVGVAGATTIFYDNFESDTAILNKNNFTNWAVTDGTVDLIGTGTQWNYFPEYGKFVDMDGSTGNAGKMVLTPSLNLFAGNYLLSFDLAGNQRQGYGDDAVRVEIPGFGSKDYSLSTFAPFQNFSQSFSLASATTIQFSFEGMYGDNVGMLLDNINLEKVDPVPEPATMLLFGTGLVGLAAVGIRRKKK